MTYPPVKALGGRNILLGDSVADMLRARLGKAYQDSPPFTMHGAVPVFEWHNERWYVAAPIGRLGERAIVRFAAVSPNRMDEPAHLQAIEAVEVVLGLPVYVSSSDVYCWYDWTVPLREPTLPTVWTLQTIEAVSYVVGEGGHVGKVVTPVISAGTCACYKADVRDADLSTDDLLRDRIALVQNHDEGALRDDVPHRVRLTGVAYRGLGYGSADSLSAYTYQEADDPWPLEDGKDKGKGRKEHKERKRRRGRKRRGGRGGRGKAKGGRC